VDGGVELEDVAEAEQGGRVAGDEVAERRAGKGAEEAEQLGGELRLEVAEVGAVGVGQLALQVAEPLVEEEGPLLVRGEALVDGLVEEEAVGGERERSGHVGKAEREG